MDQRLSKIQELEELSEMKSSEVLNKIAAIREERSKLSDDSSILQESLRDQKELLSAEIARRDQQLADLTKRNSELSVALKRNSELEDYVELLLKTIRGENIIYLIAPQVVCMTTKSPTLRRFCAV